MNILLTIIERGGYRWVDEGVLPKRVIMFFITIMYPMIAFFVIPWLIGKIRFIKRILPDKRTGFEFDWARGAGALIICSLFVSILGGIVILWKLYLCG